MFLEPDGGVGLIVGVIVGKDKGKARKSLSTDKAMDRISNNLSTTGDNAMEGFARSVDYKSSKINLNPKKRQELRDTAQWAYGRAAAIRSSQSSSPTSLKAAGRGK